MVPNLEVGAPKMGHKINLRRHEMLNKREKKKNIVTYIHVFIRHYTAKATYLMTEATVKTL